MPFSLKYAKVYKVFYFILIMEKVFSKKLEEVRKLIEEADINMVTSQYFIDLLDIEDFMSNKVNN